MGPVIGASIVEKGTTNGTVTNLQGDFSLSVSSDKAVIEISYIGYQPQELKVIAGKPLNVTMKEDAQALEEVVVVGYGSQKKVNVIGSIAAVDSKKLESRTAPSVSNMLTGQLSGVTITQSSGNPGQDQGTIRVRGVGSFGATPDPLVLVDGLPGSLNDLNPADIESISILKDASSAAIYGSRAANGVILITTKQGQSGKVKVSYDGFVGFSNATDFYEMMNAQEYVDFKNLAVKNRYGTDELSLTTGYVSPYGNKAFNMMKDANGNYVDTDWKDAAFQNGLSQSHSVAVSGGSDKVRYYLSGNYTTQEGIVKGDKYDRLGVKANINVQATDWLKVGMNTNVTTGTTSYVDAARRGSNFAVGGFPRLALINAPNLPMYNEDGTPYYLAQGLGYGGNTVFSLSLIHI